MGKRRGPNISKRDVEKVRNLFEAGLKPKQVVTLSGFSITTVHRMKQAGFNFDAYREIVTKVSTRWAAPKIKETPTAVPEPQVVTVKVVMEIKELLKKIEENTSSLVIDD